MIPQIAKALSSGFTSKQVIDFILKQFPEHSGKIKKALASGFTVDQILNYFGKEKGKSNQSGALTEHENTREADIQKRQKVNQGALGAAALAGTSIVAPLAAGAVQQSLSRALPPILNKLAPQIPSAIGSSLSGQGMQPGQQQQQQPPIENPQSYLSQQPPVNQVTPNITQPAQPVQPEVISNPKEFLEKLGVREVVDDHLKRGTSPEGITALLGANLEKKGKVKGKIDPELLKNIEEYAKQAPITNELPISNESVENKFENADIPQNQEKISPKIEKSSIVSAPQGIGEVKEIRNGKALIDIDGKLHKVDESELEESPIPEKDLAELHDDLLRGIESETGEDVSRMVQWAGYNPETNTLQFLPHTGKLYKYANISPEDAALLTDILSVRKTSGSNFIGAWKKDSKSPIGAALSKLIRKLQSERGGKGNEYEETHEPIYSAYEPAIEFKKQKKKKK
jgi:hypothetical protein